MKRRIKKGDSMEASYKHSYKTEKRSPIMLYESIKKLVQYGIDTGLTPECGSGGYSHCPDLIYNSKRWLPQEKCYIFPEILFGSVKDAASDSSWFLCQKRSKMDSRNQIRHTWHYDQSFQTGKRSESDCRCRKSEIRFLSKMSALHGKRRLCRTFQPSCKREPPHHPILH